LYWNIKKPDEMMPISIHLNVYTYIHVYKIIHIYSQINKYLWSSLASWKYNNAIVMKEVTITNIMKAKNRIPNKV
jgi:hypothetical protein